MKDVKFLKICEALEGEIQRAYTESLTLGEAEKLAARFLEVQMLCARVFANADLDARMKKSGLKAIKAAVYHAEATKTDKKPSDSFIQSVVDMNQLVADEQKALDIAEVYRDQLKTYQDVFNNSHIFFRNQSKGSYGG